MKHVFNCVADNLDVRGEEVRVALKIAYDGSGFHGFQRQPERLTVEGEIVRALAAIGAVSSPRLCGYRSSSRTDRGVSALGNVISFRTDFPPHSLCSALNSEMCDIWAISAVQVPEDFHPRAARQRWYRYYLPKSGQDVALLREFADRFVGVHDFSGYARKDDRNPMRKIDSIDVSNSGSFLILDFKAESFLWNMVRRIVWVLHEGSSGRMSSDSIGPEAAEEIRRIGLAPADKLLLMDVNCGIDFPPDEKASVGIVREIERRRQKASLDLLFSDNLARAVRSPRSQN